LKLPSSLKEQRVFEGFVTNIECYIIVEPAFSAVFANFSQFVIKSGFRSFVPGVFGRIVAVHYHKSYEEQQQKMRGFFHDYSAI